MCVWVAEKGGHAILRADYGLSRAHSPLSENLKTSQIYDFLQIVIHELKDVLTLPES